MDPTRKFMLRKGSTVYSVSETRDIGDARLNLYFTSSGEALISIFREQATMLWPRGITDRQIYLNTFVLMEDVLITPPVRAQSLQNIINSALTMEQMRTAISGDCGVEDADGYTIAYLVTENLGQDTINQIKRNYPEWKESSIKGRITGYVLCREELLAHAEAYSVDLDTLFSDMYYLETQLTTEPVMAPGPGPSLLENPLTTRGYSPPGIPTIAQLMTYLQDAIRREARGEENDGFFKALLDRLPIQTHAPGYVSPISSPTRSMLNSLNTPGRRSPGTSPSFLTTAGLQTPNSNLMAAFGMSDSSISPIGSPGGRESSFAAFSPMGSPLAFPQQTVGFQGVSPPMSINQLQINPVTSPKSPSKPLPNGEDPFLNIPPEIIRVMGQNMKLVDLDKSCRLSTRFNQLLCNNEDFWHEKVRLDFPGEKVLLIDARNPDRGKKIDPFNPNNAENRKPEGMSWKLFYRELTGMIPEDSALDFADIDD